MANAKLGYLSIQNFRFGIDARRSELTSQPGTLLRAIDCHVNQGAELEKRKAFVKTLLPTGVFLGLPTLSNQLAFGSIAPPAMPAGFVYQQLVSPLGSPMTALVGATLFNNEAFVIAQFGADGEFCFYNGVLVPDFLYGQVFGGLTTTNDQAQNLVNLVNNTSNYTAALLAPGSSDVLINGKNAASYSVTNALTSPLGTISELQNNQPLNGQTAAQAVDSFVIVAGALGTGATKAGIFRVVVLDPSLITSVILTSAAVLWQGTAIATAIAVAANINGNFVANGGYSAVANSSIVTVYAPAGTAVNGYVLLINTQSSSNNDGAICCQNCVFNFVLPAGSTVTITNIASTNTGNVLYNGSIASTSYLNLQAFLVAVANAVIANSAGTGFVASSDNTNLYVSANGDLTGAQPDSIVITYTTTGAPTISGTPAMTATSNVSRVGAGSAVVITPIGGIGPYSYSWSISNPLIYITSISSNNVSFTTSQTFVPSTLKTGLGTSVAGTATCTVTDSVGAKTTVTVAVYIVIPPPQS